MNWLDIIILVVLVGAFVIGCIAGVIKAAMSMLGVGGGIYIAGKTYTTAATWFYFINLKNEFWAKVAGFLVILLLAIIIAAILAKVLEATFETLNIKWVDRVLGGLCSMGTAFLSIGVVLTLWYKIQPASTIVASSMCAEMILQTIPLITALLPNELTVVKDFFN